MPRRLASIPALVLIVLIAACSSARPEPVSNPAPQTPSASAAQKAPATAKPTPTQAIAPDAPSSEALIDAALEKGEIDPETALTYKVFAQFNDARLPAAFRGSLSKRADSHIIAQAQADYPKLSPQTQAVLLPFFVPPVYAGAWGPPAEGDEDAVKMIDLPCDQIDRDKWDSTSAMHSPVRFWWQKSSPDGAAIANRFMAAMDDQVWPKLTALMGRVPLPDQGAKCNGDGPELDVYITAEIARSYAASYFPPGCRETPSYIVLNPGVTDAILAHEFMHAIQWSYNTAADCMYPGEYAWLAEATASWAQDYVYPDSNEEQTYVPDFYDGGGGLPPELNLKNDAHEYGANVFFFYLTHNFGNDGLVRAAWDNTTSMKSIAAVDRAIPGGLDDIWGDFAVKNMVEPPYDEYQLWDQLNVKPGGSSLLKSEAAANMIYDVTDQINRLSIQYVWFTFSEDARLVTYFNGITYNLGEEPINEYMGTIPINDNTMKYKFDQVSSDDVAGIKIQAYFKVAGDVEWQLEDWTDKPYVSFCRDAQAERLTDLIIITSNSSQDQDVYPAGYVSKLQTLDIGCWRYGGTAAMKSMGVGEKGHYTDDQTLPNVAFERTEAHPDIPYPFLHFKVAEGQFERTYRFENEECTGGGETSTALGPAPLASFGNDLYILYGATSGPSARRYGGQANADRPVQIHGQCPDGSGEVSSPSLPWFYSDVLSQLLKKVYTVKEGGAIQGSGDLLESASNAEMLYEWSFETLAESGSSGGSGSDSGGSGAGNGGSSSGSGGGSGSGSPSAPPDVPAYPNIAYANNQAAGGMLVFSTTDSSADVADFYRKHFLDEGWQDISNPNPPASEIVTLMFAKESKVVTIMVAAQEGLTQVMVNEVGE